MKLIVRDIEVKPARVPKTFTLELDDIEAATLHAICGQCAGDEKGTRKLTDSLYNSLGRYVDRDLREKISTGIKLSQYAISLPNVE